MMKRPGEHFSIHYSLWVGEHARLFIAGPGAPGFHLYLTRPGLCRTNTEALHRRNGRAVWPVFDVEATRTTGPVNRLISKKDRPPVDLFWSDEFVQTLLL